MLAPYNLHQLFATIGRGSIGRDGPHLLKPDTPYQNFFLTLLPNPDDIPFRLATTPAIPSLCQGGVDIHSPAN